jgi:CNT family concentrative nucleoside transporter
MVGTIAFGILGLKNRIGIAPNRRSNLARFGLRAVLGGSLATMLTAAIAGVLTGIA